MFLFQVNGAEKFRIPLSLSPTDIGQLERKEAISLAQASPELGQFLGKDTISSIELYVETPIRAEVNFITASKKKKKLKQNHLQTFILLCDQKLFISQNIIFIC